MLLDENEWELADEREVLSDVADVAALLDGTLEAGGSLDDACDTSAIELGTPGLVGGSGSESEDAPPQAVNNREQAISNRLQVRAYFFIGLYIKKYLRLKRYQLYRGLGLYCWSVSQFPLGLLGFFVKIAKANRFL